MKELAPKFSSPNAAEFDYAAYAQHIEIGLPSDAPPMFGLHPNAEIGYLTSSADSIFATVLRLRTGGGGAVASGGGGGGGGLRATLEDLLDRTPNPFELISLNEKAAPMLSSEHSPYVVVALQEFGRMNALLEEMTRSLMELEKGLNGQLNMSQPMEDLVEALSLNEVRNGSVLHPDWRSLHHSECNCRLRRARSTRCRGATRST